MLRRASARPLRPLLMLAAVVGALVLLGGTAAVIVGFFAVVLTLDRALPDAGAAMLDAELRFRQLARERRHDALRRRLRLGPPGERRLLYLSEHERWTATAERRQLGVQTIGLDSIIGTVERQKAGAFDHRFRPPRWSRERWARIWLAAQRGTGLPPISVYRVGHGHFVRDGHHRVSVASALATVAIDAEVVELRPRELR
jgi:hypothetical protein